MAKKAEKPTVATEKPDTEGKLKALGLAMDQITKQFGDGSIMKLGEQKSNIEVAARDDKRKISINAMYYALEEVYYPSHGSYPKTLSAATLTSVDKALFKDPNGVQIGKADADFHYQGKDCTGEVCKSYELRATLENEADFVKNSRHS